MYKPVRHTCLLILTVAFAGSVPAAVIHVPADEPTIQAGINAAKNGDKVLVGPGTYFENIEFEGKRISVVSEAGPEQTIIDGNNSFMSIVLFEGGETRKTVLNGFTIQHGGASGAAGIYLFASSATISHNIFRENGAGGEYGTAITCNICSALITGNTFEENNCDVQDISSVLDVFNGSQPLIVNNVFANNPCRAVNLIVPAEAAPTIANNTFVGNREGIFLSLVSSPAAHLYANNIVVDNEVGLEVEGLGTNELPWLNNLVFGNRTNYVGISDQTGMHGNISVSPRFVSLRNLNVQLRPGSPAIDAGTAAVPQLPSRDFAGNPRVVDGDGDRTAEPDIGAFEFVP
jgi:hypothetical protein